MKSVNHVKYLECIRCGEHVAPEPNATLCPKCRGLLEVVYDYGYISRKMDRKSLVRNPDRSIWRYAPFLPVKEGGRHPNLEVGGSPLYHTPRLAREIGLATLYIKDDGQNPTASLKDRASAVAVVKAMEAKASTIACSSTGNAASSLAGNAAAAGLKTVIFVPGRAPQGKVAQLLIFGAHVVSVQGSYEDAFNLSAAAIDRYGWYNRNAAINPYLMEGKKTVSLEIAEQLHFQVPDWVVVSVGDGCTIAGVYKGFYDLQQVGWIDKIPRILGVQAAGCAPISKAFHSGKPLEPSPENTLADSIAVGVPRNPDKALRAVRESRGTYVEVTDEEILTAMRLLGRTCGIFGEPAGVAGLAGLQKAVAMGIVGPAESVVCVVTGNGLKDVANGIKAAGEPLRIDPDVDQLTKALAAHGIV